MKLLALETSTEQLSLAVMAGDAVFTYEEIVGNASSAHVLPQIQALLAQANLSLANLDGIAYGAGPGSFTGVRIATGVTQGLAFAHALPVFGVSTLLALAAASDHDKVIACLDARMGEVYHASFVKTAEGWLTQDAPGVSKPDAVPKVVGNDWVGVGSGWQAHGEVLSQVYDGQLAQTQPEKMPSATAILQLASPELLKGNGLPAAQALPLYVRNRVALTTKQREAGERL